MAEATAFGEPSLKTNHSIDVKVVNGQETLLNRQDREIFQQMQIKCDGIAERGYEDKQEAYDDYLSYVSKNKILLEKSIKSNSVDDITTTLLAVNNVLGTMSSMRPPILSNTERNEEVVPLRRFMVELLSSNIGKIEKVLDETTDMEDIQVAVHSVGWLVSLARHYEKSEHIDEYIYLPMKNIERLVPLIRTQSGEQAMIFFVRKTLTIAEHSEKFPGVKDGKEILVRLLKSEDPNLREAIIDMMSRMQGLDKTGDIISLAFGVNGKSMVSAWKDAEIYEKGNGGSIIGESFKQNLSFLLELEQKRPGIGKVLQSEFGINDFARYPEDLLIAQYDERDRKDLPYGSIIYARADSNGAFYSHKELFAKLTDQLKGRYRLRVWEVGDPLNLVGALNKSRHKFGPASFAIIGAHGSPEAINLGSNKQTAIRKSERESTQLSVELTETQLGKKKHLPRRGPSPIERAFTKDPIIVLFSCSTGQLPGIAQKISDLAWAKVIAPPKEVGIENIDSILGPSGEIDFTVQYGKDKDGRTIPPQIYKAGVLLNNFFSMGDRKIGN